MSCIIKVFPRHRHVLVLLGLPLGARLNMRFPNHSKRSVGRCRMSHNIALMAAEVPVDRIRNFSIVAHVDHGKSTLADRLLEITGVISTDNKNQQVLDKLQVERERGITVKAQTATLFHKHHGSMYMLNLIDTPGHVDFSYEVSRSLAACQGVVLLVDAAQGVQAQTVANYRLAVDANLTVIPVLNKIDLKQANVEQVTKQLVNLFNVNPNDVIEVSAKSGLGVSNILSVIIERIPALQARQDGHLKALLFDLWFDHFRGVVCLMAILDGHIREGDQIVSASSQKLYTVSKLGIMHPNETPTGALYAGQVGYVVTGMRNVDEARVGDTFYRRESPVQALPGFRQAKPMVFASLFPSDQSEFTQLKSAIEKLTLNDASVTIHQDNSVALGQGFRLGFLGLLHMDVFTQRLEQEFDASVIVTAPSVPYKARMKRDGNEVTILTPAQFPEKQHVIEYLEPIVEGTLIFPQEHIGKMLNLCMTRRGQQQSVIYIDESRVMLKYILPLSEIVIDFFDQLKSLSSGYASFDYEDCGYQCADLAKIDVLLNGRAVDALACIVHQDQTNTIGKQLCMKLRDVIPRQLYEVAIQASVRGKVVARETVKALRKDVTAKLYGGDVTRKMKLLKRQKEGKRKMKQIGNIELPKEAFLSVIRR
ncbi:translation factor GUF1 homolog, mitochondrial-like [Corticium candelabrum]|uniref:translation factor GUF1 homolog, mitochondrial-like n=1 Tax=Corticium candelabrum TaxID=121492 RepID=UPI002E263E1F|nr:translation factor GUF1 homolog, mitochondrial-like [Corticium candelabrum]